MSRCWTFAGTGLLIAPVVAFVIGILCSVFDRGPQAAYGDIGGILVMFIVGVAGLVVFPVAGYLAGRKLDSQGERSSQPSDCCRTNSTLIGRNERGEHYVCERCGKAWSKE